MNDKIFTLKDCIKKQKPLIHCITNPISINQCANAILSVGAKPIMAEHPKEVCEITCVSKALMLNTGNITDVRMESILLSAKTAKENHIPTLLDAVGTACSRLRREYIWNLLKTAVPSVIKGNYSEITALNDNTYFSPGVDSEPSLNLNTVSSTAKKLAKKYKTVILATGQTDIITDGEKTIYVKNGTPVLASVTGTGCILGSLCTAFMTAAPPFDATVSACCYFGICGELSVTDKGNATFMINLLDKISTLSAKEISEHIKLEGI